MKAQKKLKFNAQQLEKFYLIDILRVFFALIILNYHVFNVYNIVNHNVRIGGGGLIVMPFFMISGFFFAAKPAPKEIKVWKHTVKKILRQLFMILLALFLALIYSLILLGIQRNGDWWKPVFDAHGCLWYIFILWHVDFVYALVLRYAKEDKKVLIVSLLTAFGLIWYICTIIFTNYWINSPQFVQSLFVGFNNMTRGLCGTGLGVLIWFIYNARDKQHKRSNKAKTWWTILGIVSFVAALLLTFLLYDRLWVFLAIALYWLTLLICFNKLGWISEKTKISDGNAKNCRNFSMILYIFHHCVVTFVAYLMKGWNFYIYAVITMFSALAYVIPLFFFVPRLNAKICSKIPFLANKK